MTICNTLRDQDFVTVSASVVCNSSGSARNRHVFLWNKGLKFLHLYPFRTLGDVYGRCCGGGVPEPQRTWREVREALGGALSDGIKRRAKFYGYVGFFS